jgi:hypothetical protein
LSVHTSHDPILRVIAILSVGEGDTGVPVVVDTDGGGLPPPSGWVAADSTRGSDSASVDVLVTAVSRTLVLA